MVEDVDGSEHVRVAKQYGHSRVRRIPFERAGFGLAKALLDKGIARITVNNVDLF